MISSLMRMQEELITDNADLQGGVILQGTFKAQQGKDCPQRTLYLPAPLLKENNTITVVENARAKDCLAIMDKHLL